MKSIAKQIAKTAAHSAANMKKDHRTAASALILSGIAAATMAVSLFIEATTQVNNKNVHRDEKKK